MAVSKEAKSGKKRHTKVSSVLVSQPKPQGDSPYIELARKHGIKVDFRPFIEVEPVSYKEFRREKINIQDFTAIIFTSRNAVDQFFRSCYASFH
ncbi:MAG: hypothetical protein EOP51_16610 [Sphingobacteriales bacterium]|nr:MAG: hypothetical protein EOP51_16610 [Sphingobacteriales bacterium]